MDTQKNEIISHVRERKEQGISITQTLKSLGINRSTYYRWLKEKDAEPKEKIHPLYLTPLEKRQIIEKKDDHPGLRHRQIQGLLQLEGVYLSASSVYRELKAKDLVESYERRPAPSDEALYEVYQRNVMWGSDWSKLKISGVRYYLLTLIDFYSRFVVEYRVLPSITAADVKEIYQAGLDRFNIPYDWWLLPALRVDRGSPNTSNITKEFFKDIGADLTFSRVRRPTDNALTERFYGTIKQEEIYLVGEYPDEQSATEEIGKYIDYYNFKRPHQSLFNFTPHFIFDLNNKTQAMELRAELKKDSLEKRKVYWKEFKAKCLKIEKPDDLLNS